MDAHPWLGTCPPTSPCGLSWFCRSAIRQGLDNFLKEVYDPSSPSFRQFLTVEQFTERFGPTQADYETVKQFAKDNGLTVVGDSRNRVNLDVVGTVANIEKAFHVTMGVYQHPTENRTYLLSGPRAHHRSAGAVVAHRGPGQLFHPEALYVHRAVSAETVHANATTGSCPSNSFLRQ